MEGLGSVAAVDGLVQRFLSLLQRFFDRGEQMDEILVVMDMLEWLSAEGARLGMLRNQSTT